MGDLLIDHRSLEISYFPFDNYTLTHTAPFCVLNVSRNIRFFLLGFLIREILLDSLREIQRNTI